MSYKILATVTTSLGAAAAAMAALPYGWAHVTATSIAGVLAALHPVNAGLAKVYGKTTVSNPAGDTKLPKKVRSDLLTGGPSYERLEIDGKHELRGETMGIMIICIILAIAVVGGVILTVSRNTLGG